MDGPTTADSVNCFFVCILLWVRLLGPTTNMQALDQVQPQEAEIMNGSCQQMENVTTSAALAAENRAQGVYGNDEDWVDDVLVLQSTFSNLSRKATIMGHRRLMDAWGGTSQVPPKRNTVTGAQFPGKNQIAKKQHYFYITLHWLGELEQGSTQNNPHIEGEHTQKHALRGQGTIVWYNGCPTTQPPDHILLTTTRQSHGAQPTTSLESAPRYVMTTTFGITSRYPEFACTSILLNTTTILSPNIGQREYFQKQVKQS